MVKPMTVLINTMNYEPVYWRDLDASLINTVCDVYGISEDARLAIERNIGASGIVVLDGFTEEEKRLITLLAEDYE